MSEEPDIIIQKIDQNLGSIHPINQMKDHIMSFLSSIGFTIIDGPEIETEKYNFDMLNIKKSHPARQMHDTFYVNKKEFVLRTHTSPVQIRGMLDNKPPLAFISGGKVYRKDDDATHLPMFHQIEGIYVDTNVNFGHLKDLIYKIIYFLFGNDVKLRFRPSYFPFTEPSAEVDIWDEERDQWMEILGCGMVDPSVLDNVGYDSRKWHGYAFGMGVERIAMIKHSVKDIRDFYKSNLDFLSQFK